MLAQEPDLPVVAVGVGVDSCLRSSLAAGRGWISYWADARLRSGRGGSGAGAADAVGNDRVLCHCHGKALRHCIALGDGNGLGLCSDTTAAHSGSASRELPALQTFMTLDVQRLMHHSCSLLCF